MSHRYLPQRDADSGDWYLPVHVKGRELLEDPIYNKGTAWPEAERKALDILGLLPPHVSSEREQLTRVYENFQRKRTDIDRYIFLQGLHDRNETLFYKLLGEHLDEMLPVVYTPTVGHACRDFHHLFRRPRGLYVAADHAGDSAAMLRAATRGRHISVAVVTDGERILGLGDLGANGMGIPIGKLSLYVSAGGFHPAETVPILLDVGTDNDDLRAHPLYLGSRRERLRGAAYDEVVARFVAGFRQACPDALLQFEDFAKGNAFRLLDGYRDRLPSFNDDIQGTGAVATAVVLAAARRKGTGAEAERVLLVGAGSAGVGIGRTLVRAGVPRAAVFLRDSRGVVVEGDRVDPVKGELAADPERVAALGLRRTDAPLAEVVAALKPTVLIGTTGQHGLFDEPVIRALAKATEQPLVLPLSNPTSLSEADPADVIRWSEGRAVVATGSPFPAVEHDGRTYPIGQCNNVFVFPGVGLGVKLASARRVDDSMFTSAAQALADKVPTAALGRGQLLPTVAQIREVSVAVAAAVAAAAVACGATDAAADVDWDQRARDAMWTPRYLPYRYQPETAA